MRCNGEASQAASPRFPEIGSIMMMMMIYVFNTSNYLFAGVRSIKNMYNDYDHKEVVRASRIGLRPSGFRWKKNVAKKRNQYSIG